MVARKVTPDYFHILGHDVCFVSGTLIFPFTRGRVHYLCDNVITNSYLNSTLHKVLTLRISYYFM